METTVNEADTLLSRERLQHFFIEHLDHIYCGKIRMIDHFRKIAGLAHTRDLILAIRETADDIENQINRMREIFVMLNAPYNQSACVGMAAMLDEAMMAVNEAGDDMLRDMAILFYLQNIEGIEAASFQVMQLASRSIGIPEIEQLIRENFDEAREDRALLIEIVKRYISA